ncbi:DUF488 domain-containing protein [Actinospica sp.]|jgi:uncharacterized protein YeaO (DUF488 family)|uniref:DUF488 domain-containing protein n=1 Tax=Actinospica sp. TaxID=1872142 RepID=UPI002D0776CB|nr:DUF488 family protein [Actinospica sp.]HWG23445.1 DUF488 family protein [Actinospica sp.]
MPSGFRVKRVYEPVAEADGTRVLVDRLWPRGVKKQTAHLDEWAKDLSPSNELRSWFHADREERFEEFSHRYAAELSAPEQRERLAELRTKGESGTVTLLTGAADPSHSHLSVLLDELTAENAKKPEK